MKHLRFLFVLMSFSCNGQTYHLLPDTCTYCSFVYSTDGTDFVQATYLVSPDVDTTLMGNSYLVLPQTSEIYFGVPLTGVRQVGNKIFGASAVGPTQEYLVQDWDVQIGDTVFDLYSNRTYYDAVFVAEDSIVLNDGSYHHIREMKGIGYYPNGIYDSTTWTFFWQERGLCGEHVVPYFAIAGGLTYNLPDFTYGASYVSYYLPQAHTADLRYDKNDFMDSCEFVYALIELDENSIDHLLIYPNPTTGLIYLKHNMAVQIRILGLNGQEVLRFVDQISSFDIGKLENGVYFIEITDESNISKVKRIIKSN